MSCHNADLFSVQEAQELEAIELEDASLLYGKSFFSQEQAQAFLSSLKQELVWQQPKVRLFGKTFPVPRQVAWAGDPGLEYSYSGLTHTMDGWTTTTSAIRDIIEEKTGFAVNSVLLNYYHNGQHSMGWHADNEPELGHQPVIVSLSLGAPRRFILRHNKTRETFELQLGQGDLLVMYGDTQHCWQHSLPKTAKSVGERLNLTYRRIL